MLHLNQIGKRFNRDWIFRKLSFDFEFGKQYAILGPNGSGKSTLLQSIAGNIGLSEGSVDLKIQSEAILPEFFFRHLSFSAPYIELVEEFTLREFVDFHFQFKKYKKGMQAEELIALMHLEKFKDKVLQNFSSGMKQRVKLAVSFASDTEMLLLDEPCTNLDSEGIAWYHSLIDKFTGNRLVIIGSNQEYEYDFCSERLHISNYKNI